MLIAPTFDEPARVRLRGISEQFDLQFLEGMTRAQGSYVSDQDAQVFVGLYPPEPLALLPRLRWIQLQSAGFEHIVRSDPWARGITVTNGAGVFAIEMAEYVVGALLDANKLGPDRRAHQAARIWPSDPELLTGRVLRGQTVAIVGYGGVGREIARVCSALGMRVLAVKARPNDREDTSYRVPGTGDPDASIPDRIVGFDQLDEVASEADALVLATSLTRRSRGLIDGSVLAALPSHAVFVNVARGALVVENALLRALQSGTVRAAYLDVFSTEPLPPDDPLWSAPNCFVTPHVAGGDEGAWGVFTDLLAENLRRFAANQPLINVVDRSRAE